MFSQLINSPIAPLTENFFANYKRPRREYDYTLSCLGVALFHDRIENYNGIAGTFEVASPLNMPQMVQSIYTLRKQSQEWETVPGFYYLAHNAIGREIANEIKDINTDTFVELEQVEMYIKQQTQVANFFVFVNAETNSVFILAPSTNFQLYHLSLAFVYAYYPNLFKEKPLDQSEVLLLKLLTSNSASKFTAALTAKLEPLRKSILRFELSKCFEGFREQRIQVADRRVQVARDTVENYLSQYRDAMAQLEQSIIEYEGIKATNGDDTKEQEIELVNYLSENSSIRNVTFNGGYLQYDVLTQLTNFDRMKWKSAVRMHDIFNSYRLDQNNVFSNLSARKMLLETLFDTDDPELTVNLVGEIRLYLNRNFMEVVSGDIALPDAGNYLTNPHYKYHGCPGRNRDQIIDCLTRGDVIAAVECSIAATGSVNIGETEYTFRRMVQEILTSNEKIIHRFDGVDLTPAEALLWIAAKHKGEEVA